MVDGERKEISMLALSGTNNGCTERESAEADKGLGPRDTQAAL